MTKYLANGMRFKVAIRNKEAMLPLLPEDLGGRWVALVAAEDDCHLEPAPDCRTCANSFDSYDKPNCMSLEDCTNGDKYQPAPSVVLWRAE